MSNVDTKDVGKFWEMYEDIVGAHDVVAADITAGRVSTETCG